jgi:hypothetical protein
VASFPTTANESWSASSIRSRRPGAAKAASALRRERPWLLGGAERSLVALLLAVKFMLTSVVVDAAERLLVDDDEVPGWHCESKRSRRARNLHFAAEDHSNG